MVGSKVGQFVQPLEGFLSEGVDTTHEQEFEIGEGTQISERDHNVGKDIESKLCEVGE